jgi:hypothetical protein
MSGGASVPDGTAELEATPGARDGAEVWTPALRLSAGVG